MPLGNITSADSTAVLSVEELYPSGVLLEQYSTDAAVSQGDDTIAETRMGVDGQMVAGYVPSIKTVTVTLEASSPSIKVFNDIYQASQANRRFYKLRLTVSVPALKRTITYSEGVLKTGKFMPDINKTLQPVAFQIDFGKVS
jgi:hypothetical protein